MRTADVKRYFSVMFPLVVLIAAFYATTQMATLSSSQLELVTLSPYISVAVGMLLSIHFHRGRPFFALLLVSLFYWIYQTFLREGIDDLVHQQIFYACALFLPINYLILACIRERGIFTEAGAKRVCVLAGQIVFAYWLFKYNYSAFEPLLLQQLVKAGGLDTFAVPQPLLVYTLCCYIVIAVLASLRQSPVENGMLGCLTALFIALNWIEASYVPEVFCTAGALTVIFSVLQDSYNMAFRDDLTGIPSRRSLNESLHSIGSTYAIAMLDIDHFKNFNDTYGHDVGDQVLKLVAKKMMGVGGGGKAYRYGGEEFAILFPGKGVDDAYQHLEDLRKVIADYRLSIRGTNRPGNAREGKSRRGKGSADSGTSVTVSIGIAENGGALDTAEDVMKAADKALYSAKNSGRNQVCRFTATKSRPGNKR